ncbi:MAG TPA: hypothetical protein VGZ91_12180 [Candidatus Sulfotelmatobacter sp.]|jgi:hypothetical protein|nr:hypothetical protein [Candidatus Sulfotelmatobacter sp.]
MSRCVACLLFVLASVLFFSERFVWSQLDDSVLQVTAKGKAITIREHGKDHTYNFEDDLQLREIGQVKLLFQNGVRGKLYLLMYVLESIGTGNGQCGAGQEEYLIWQVLDVQWEQHDHKLALIGSCALSIENQTAGPDPYVIKQGKLTSEYIDYPDNYVKRTRTLTYDSATPEKAWTIQQNTSSAK